MKDEVKKIVEQNKGVRLFEIQEQLDIEKSALIQILQESDDFIQDNSYRWHLKDSEFFIPEKDAKPSTSIKNEESNIANYYLNCLAQEDAKEVSFWAESHYDDYDYFEINSLDNIDSSWSENDAFKEANNKNNRKRFKKQLYLAYPLNLSITPKGTKILEPLFLVPFENGMLNDLFASMNEKVFQKYSHGSSFELSSEARDLSNTLKIGDIAVLPRIDEIAEKIYSLKPDWAWKEKIDPNNLSTGKIKDCDAAGLYNKAAVVLVDKSKFTFGLTAELEGIKNEDSSSKNALKDWLLQDFSSISKVDEDPIIEPLEMNQEQREAVKSALNKKLTVITGPPGTGKSQVVTNILVNASLRGKRVLFASRNNKAVDVVHARANGICEKEFVNRLGNNYESNLSIQINKILSFQGNKNEVLDEFSSIENDYKNLQTKKQLTERKLEQLRKDRNKLSKVDEELKLLIEKYGEKFLVNFNKKKKEIMTLLEDYEKKLSLSIKENHGFLVQIFWSFFQKEKLEEKNTSKNLLNKTFKKIKAPKNIEQSLNKDKLNEIRDEIGVIKKYTKLKESCNELLKSLRDTDIVELQKTLLDNQKQVSNISATYWNSWLKRLPFKVTANQKKAIGEAASLLDLITQKRENNERVTSEMRRYVAMFPEISKVLSAWAVSSLSVRNRIPFESGFFDLLVIDEASQCDIASAVPLLYRAKNVVVIGDSNQLKHITGINASTDRVLMDQFNLIEKGQVNWSYSVNSLFDLASRICQSESLVMLKDHHRSRSEIINFSNKHFYDEQLRVATNYQKLKIPARDEAVVRWVDVKGNVEQVGGRGAINNNEIDAVVKEIRRIVLEQNYTGSVGVVTPFRKQAERINEAVNRDPNLVHKLSLIDFLCNTAHAFQGDERDIIIFSTVINGESRDSLEGFLRKQPNLFNVALTRARCSLIMVGDRSFAKDCSINYLKSFSNYVAELNAKNDETVESAKRGELISDPSVIISDYEKTFFNLMKENGLEPYTQYPVDKYKLDFAFIKGDKKLNVEIDGEEYHKSWTGERLRRDIIRNHRLVEEGWDVMRIWVYELEDYSEEYIKKIKDYLA